MKVGKLNIRQSIKKERFNSIFKRDLLYAFPLFYCSNVSLDERGRVENQALAALQMKEENEQQSAKVLYTHTP